MPEENKPEVPASPTTLKVGDKEYTAEQIEQLEKANAEKDEQYKNLQSDYSKKSARLSELEKSDLTEKADKIISGEISASEMTEQEKEDFEYMTKKLNLVPESKLEQLLAKVKEDATKEVEEKLTKKEKLAQTEKEIDTLASQHTFIDKEKLKEYLSERAKGGTVLTVDEAATLLYKDQFIANNIKPADLPGAEKGNKGTIEEPKPKILPLGSSAMSERIAERLNKVN